MVMVIMKVRICQMLCQLASGIGCAAMQASTQA